MKSKTAKCNENDLVGRKCQLYALYYIYIYMAAAAGIYM